MSARVRDLMTTEVTTLAAGDDLERARELFYRLDVRHLPVVSEDGELLGLVTHRDLLRRSFIERSDLPPLEEVRVLRQTKVRDVMRTLVDTIAPDAPLLEAARVILELKCALPVVEGGCLVGLLTEADFVRRIVEQESAAGRD